MYSMQWKCQLAYAGWEGYVIESGVGARKPMHSGMAQSRGRRSGGKSPYGWIIAASLYVLVIGALSAANMAGPDHWWVSAVNMYLPQWIWLFPGALFATAAIRHGIRWLVFGLVCALWVLVPMMGLTVHRTVPGRMGGAARIRVMTYNVKWGKRNLFAIVKDIRLQNPDLILMQDANTDPATKAVMEMAVAPRFFQSCGQYIVASRTPITSFDEKPMEFPGGRFSYVRCEISAGDRRLAIYDVHLYTPRDGLTAIKSLDPAAIAEFRANCSDRLYQSALVASSVRAEKEPVLLAGDLNAPVQSIVCRTLERGGLKDAFSASGQGYGYTYGDFPDVGDSFLRIDHIMAGRGLRPAACWTGNGLGSAHRPVIADIDVDY